MVVVTGLIGLLFARERRRILNKIQKNSYCERKIESVVNALLDLSKIADSAIRYRLYRVWAREFIVTCQVFSELLKERLVQRNTFVLTIHDQKTIAPLRLLSKNELRILSRKIQQQVDLLRTKEKTRYKKIVDNTIIPSLDSNLVLAFDFIQEILIS
jgi:hypothetical protein